MVLNMPSNSSTCRPTDSCLSAPTYQTFGVGARKDPFFGVRNSLPSRMKFVRIGRLQKYFILIHLTIERQMKSQTTGRPRTEVHDSISTTCTRHI